eukprot:symbB.v1.2.039386.t1/scaffold6530.1/size17355/1
MVAKDPNCPTQFRSQLKGVQQIQAACNGSFAAILQDGSVVTWGVAGWCGDSSAVQDQLRGVQQIQSTGTAFAALLEDGCVVAWGGEQYGGDSSAVGEQLRGVQKIQATSNAFAAILEDGCVVAWGGKDHGGDSSAVQDELTGVDRKRLGLKEEQEDPTVKYEKKEEEDEKPKIDTDGKIDTCDLTDEHDAVWTTETAPEKVHPVDVLS